MAAKPSFEDEPIFMICPFCCEEITTHLSFHAGTLCWFLCGLLIFVGLWQGCCIIPFYIKALKDCEHSCPNCCQTLGRYEKSKNGKAFEPMDVVCHSCNSKVTTEVKFEAGLSSWIGCLVFSYLGLVFGCCLIPFLHKRFKDCIHSCPNCKQLIKKCIRHSD